MLDKKIRMMYNKSKDEFVPLSVLYNTEPKPPNDLDFTSIYGFNVMEQEVRIERPTILITKRQLREENVI